MLILSPGISCAVRGAPLFGLRLPARLTLCSFLLSIPMSFGGLVLSKEPTLGIVRAGEGALFATPQLVSGTASESELRFLVSEGCGDGGLSPFMPGPVDPVSAGSWCPSLVCIEGAVRRGSIWWPLTCGCCCCCCCCCWWCCWWCC